MFDPEFWKIMKIAFIVILPLMTGGVIWSRIKDRPPKGVSVTKTKFVDSSHIVTQSGGVGRAIVGGAIAGPVGAIVGANTRGSQQHHQTTFMVYYSDGSRQHKTVYNDSSEYNEYMKLLELDPVAPAVVIQQQTPASAKSESLSESNSPSTGNAHKTYIPALVGHRVLLCPNCNKINLNTVRDCMHCGESLENVECFIYEEPKDEAPEIEVKQDLKPNDGISLIESLADLHRNGILTDEEFAKKKAEILARI